MNLVQVQDTERKAKDAVEKRRWTSTRVWLGLVLSAYLLVTLAYGVVNPLFEAPDEHMHYFTMQYLIDNGELPAVAPGASYDEWLGQEAAQPPLYYLLGSLFVAPLNPDDPREVLWPNEFTTMGNASSQNNINRFVHGESESWPWQGYVGAVHLLRVLSALIGLGTLLFIFGSGRLLWPDHPYRALLATALVAFLPQYNFLHASVTNDVLIILLVSAALWQIIRLWLKGATNGRLLLLGVTIGLAALSKNAGITLLVYAVGILLLLAIRGQPGSKSAPDAAEQEAETDGLSGSRLVISAAIFVVLPALLLAGWLWARNWLLYGDFTATNQFIRIAGGDRAYTILEVLGESSGLWLSLFAVFGWFNLRPPDWVYWFWNGVALLAVGGVLWSWARRIRLQDASDDKRERRQLKIKSLTAMLDQAWVLPGLLAVWVVMVYASLMFFMLQTEAAQGRLLFPALLPLALGTAYGLTAVPIMRRVSMVVPALALLITVYCLFYVIRPAYALPAVVEDLPPDAAELDVMLGKGLTLVGAEIETEKAAAGAPVWMTLYWQSGSAIEEPPEFAVSIFGRELEEIGKLHSMHGRGMYPANLWPPGEIIADRFAVHLNEVAVTPTLGRVRVSIVDGGEDVQAGEVKIVPDNWPRGEEQALAQIGEKIALLSTNLEATTARAGDTVRVDVQWRVLQPPQAELTTLVHVGQADQAPLAVGDQPPLNGDYPTRVWEAGEIINDFYTITLPADLAPGRYPLWIGLYDSETITRWPLVIEGQPQSHNVYLAGWLEVEA